MAVNDLKTLSDTLAFRIGVLGARLTERFAEQIDTLDLKPKHAGMLVVLSTGGGLSQQEVADQMMVAPSLVVLLADHLERIGAIERTRDAEDRRRHNLTLTRKGRELLARCTRIALRIDHALTADLTSSDRDLIQQLIATITATEGINLPTSNTVGRRT